MLVFLATLAFSREVFAVIINQNGCFGAPSTSKYWQNTWSYSPNPGYSATGCQDCPSGQCAQSISTCLNFNANGLCVLVSCQAQCVPFAGVCPPQPSTLCNTAYWPSQMGRRRDVSTPEIFRRQSPALAVDPSTKCFIVPPTFSTFSQSWTTPASGGGSTTGCLLCPAGLQPVSHVKCNEYVNGQCLTTTCSTTCVPSAGVSTYSTVIKASTAGLITLLANNNLICNSTYTNLNGSATSPSSNPYICSSFVFTLFFKKTL